MRHQVVENKAIVPPLTSDQAESILLRAARVLSSARRDSMFEDLILGVTDLLDADVGILGLYVTVDGVPSIDTLACCSSGKLLPRSTYPLAGTPCETVIGQEFRFYSENVGYLFPESDAKDNHIEGYAAFPLFDEDDEQLGILTVMSTRPLDDVERAESLLRLFSERAVSEIRRIAAEDALRTSEEHYRTMFNASVDGLALLTPDGTIVDINPAVEKLYGYSREEMVGQQALQFTDARNRETVAQFLHEVNENHFAEMVDVAFNRDGAEFYIEPRGVRVEHQGSPHVLVIIRDVTQSKTGEQALRESEDRLSATIETALECIISMDQDGRVLDMNPAAVETFGYVRDAAIGQPLAELIIPERYREAHRLGMQRVIESGESKIAGQRIEVTGMKANGAEFPVEISLGMSRGANGIIFIGYLRDITERRKADEERAALEAQLRQAQKMEAIGHLAGGVAHDFNNILTSVLGYVELAHDHVAAMRDLKLNRYLQRAQKSGERARDLIQQMLTFSRGQQGEPRPLNLEPVVDEAMSLLESMVPSSIRIRTDLEKRLPMVVQDPVHIEQILVNLCINARDAMEGEGTLAVSLDRVRCDGEICSSCRQTVDGGFVRLTIGDTGPGMDEQLVDRIFEPFFSTKEAGKGSGMGLATVHGIAHENGGHIIVDSSPGNGTRMQVLFPASDVVGSDSGPASMPRASRSQMPGLEGEVFVVDDNPSVAEFLEDLLSGWGLKVTAFTDPEDALKHFLARADAYRFAILDQTMPTITGLKLAEIMLRSHPDLPIVLYTGYSDIVNESMIEGSGIRALVKKPLDIDEFYALVSTILAAENS